MQWRSNRPWHVMEAQIPLLQSDGLEHFLLLQAVKSPMMISSCPPSTCFISFSEREELFYCLFPSGSADTPETRGRSTHTACRRSGIHNSFPADFNGRSRFRRPLIRYAPKHPRKGFRGKVEIHRTIAAGPCITGHRKTRVQGFCRKRTFPFAESIYYT